MAADERPLDEQLLDERSVLDFLVAQGVPLPSSPRVSVLGGGVSNVVMAVDGDRASDGYVVKQSLARLRVAEEWHAPQSRLANEAAAIALTRGLTPAAVPALVAVDERRHVLVIERAPPMWRDWRSLLLDGIVDPGVGESLGTTVATWHRSTTASVDVPPALRERTAFEQLRIDPYFLASARRHPDLAGPLGAVVDRLRAERTCLVHGDLSPKNVLVGDAGQCWVIDFEVACLGHPAFDVAFLLTHLTLKQVHLPHVEDVLDECARAFSTSYGRGVPPQLRDDPFTAALVGALLVARVAGKSPADYLDADGRARVLGLGRRILLERPSSWGELQALRREGRPGSRT